MGVPVLAFLSSVLFAVGSTQQRRAAARVPRGEGGSIQLLWRLLRTRRWLFGSGLAAMGLVLHALALKNGSLVVVQGIVATGLVIAIGIEAYGERRRPTTGEIIGAVVLVVGVTLLVSAQPASDGSPGPWQSLVAGLVALAGAGGALLLARRPGAGQWTARALGSSAGLCFAIDALFLKATVDTLPAGLDFDWPAPAGLVLAVAGFVATSMLGNLAIQRGYQLAQLRVVQPGLTGTEPVAAYLIGLLLLGEDPAAGSGAIALTAGVALTVAGLVAVALSNPSKPEDDAAQPPLDADAAARTAAQAGRH